MKPQTKSRKRVMFCFECGKKLRGPFGRTAILKADGRERSLHAACLAENESDYSQATRQKERGK